MEVHKILWKKDIWWWTQYIYGGQSKCVVDKRRSLWTNNVEVGQKKFV